MAVLGYPAAWLRIRPTRPAIFNDYPGADEADGGALRVTVQVWISWFVQLLVLFIIPTRCDIFRVGFC
jgi:hypothetical protein